jgi:hypothetical protein
VTAYHARVELIAQGRMGEVYAYGEGKVVKLDRPEWNGVSEFEADVIGKLATAGLPVARAHGVVTIDDRCGVVLDRVEGEQLRSHILEGGLPAITGLSERFADLQMTINTTTIEGFPDLVPRLEAELAASALAPGLVSNLTGLLRELDDGARGVCHYDFHPLNVLVGPTGWVVIDWLAVASGPAIADLARTLVLWGQATDPILVEFMRQVRRRGLTYRGADDEVCDAWVRVVAGARTVEGFDGAELDWLRRVAEGSVPLFV